MDMPHEKGARPRVKEEVSYGYARAEDLAAVFERAAETKARLKLAARSMANDAGMGSADPRQSGGHEEGVLTRTALQRSERAAGMAKWRCQCLPGPM